MVVQPGEDREQLANNDKKVIVRGPARPDFAGRMLSPFPDSSSLQAEVVHRLQRLRHERGLTLQEVYDTTGIHVARLEASKANLTVLTLATLCRHYEVTLAEFFQGL